MKHLCTTRRAKVIFLLCLTAISVGCATAPMVVLAPGADQVKIAKADSAAGLTEIGPIEVSHGSGCGGFGTKGTYEGSYKMLKNKGVEIGATYIQLITVTEPHASASCYVNKFTMRGIAFK